ncbi:hypothetical protein TanjilG_03247 [Lupinus angustifolius]|uniref:Protein kinase domain-containing protein n=1 Tax=Lupinus angustifolius TaxID=3871 RepID=A0A4P1RDL8_LUPAN|nr:hypothetical protein TanjilG_03247 [Lupinus angustifolius]
MLGLQSPFPSFEIQELLLGDDIDDDDHSYNASATNTGSGNDSDVQARPKQSQDILNLRVQNGMMCKQFTVKKTHKLVLSKSQSDTDPYSLYSMALYRSFVGGNHYAIKAFHKSHLLKLQVAASETAMPNVLLLEYVEDKWIYQGSGPACGLDEETARRYLRDIVCGLMYLQAHNIIHGDIKHDNLLITHHGTVKIGDFSVSQAFEDDNDELRRSPGTPVFTAPECIIGRTYHGKAADTWAIVKNAIVLPNDMNPQLKNLIEGLLVKDPRLRMALGDVAEHSWVIGDDGPSPGYLCWCQRK